MSSSASAGLMLPDPSLPGLSQQFGDFTVYSLPFLDNFFGGGFSVQSAPGKIAGGIVAVTGTNNVPATTNFANMDNAYPSPNNNPDYFATDQIADPGSPAGTSAFFTTNDSADSWDSTTAALRSYLATGGGSLAFLFNLNESPGGADNLDGVDMLAWAKIDLVDTTGALATKTYFLTSVGSDPDLLSSTGPEPDPADAGFNAADPRWAYIHGKIAVDPVTGEFLHFGPGGAGEATINQNLGADHAAFAIYNAELDALVRNAASGYDFFRATVYFSKIDNGYEQVFLPDDTAILFKGVPEPATFAVWSLLGGLSSVVAIRKRRREKR